MICRGCGLLKYGVKGVPCLGCEEAGIPEENEQEPGTEGSVTPRAGSGPKTAVLEFFGPELFGQEIFGPELGSLELDQPGRGAGQPAEVHKVTGFRGLWLNVLRLLRRVGF